MAASHPRAMSTVSSNSGRPARPAAGALDSGATAGAGTDTEEARMPTQEEIDAALEEAASNPDGRTTSESRTGEHDGLAATVRFERWLEVGEDEEGGVLATPMVSVELVYDGFEAVTSFPFAGPAAEGAGVAAWALGDMVDGGYHETMLLARLDQTDLTLEPREFVPAARAVMAEASEIVRAEFGL